MTLTKDDYPHKAGLREPLGLFLLKLHVKLGYGPHVHDNYLLGIVVLVTDEAGPYKEPKQVIILAQDLLPAYPVEVVSFSHGFCPNTILHSQFPFRRDVFLEQ